MALRFPFPGRMIMLNNKQWHIYLHFVKEYLYFIRMLKSTLAVYSCFSGLVNVSEMNMYVLMIAILKREFSRILVQKI